MRRAGRWLVAFAVCVVASSAVLLATRMDVAELPAAVDRLLDQRTDGERAIANAQARLASGPNDPRLLAQLGSAYLFRVRETYDPSLYTKAGALIDIALARAPRDPDVVLAAASLALSRHEFSDALSLGLILQAVAPARPTTYGVLADAYVELGRYDDAVAAAQRMVDLRPDLASYSRVSYVRELHGDLAGAIEAMRRAVEAGAPRAESTTWSEVQLGHLYFASGDLVEAERAYEDADHRIPGYVFAAAGRARVLAARGDLAAAATLVDGAAQRLPVPDLLIALADLHERMGDHALVAQDAAVVSTIERLFKANGVRTDIDLALFDADHDVRLVDALAVARAEYAARPSVTVALSLGWIEYKNGDLQAAARHAKEALRLGWRDPIAVQRASIIAAATGDRALVTRIAELSR